MDTDPLPKLPLVRVEPARPRPARLPPLLDGGLTPAELQELARAKAILENPGLAARISHVLGRPIEQGYKMLPSGWQGIIHKAARAALTAALHTAVRTLGPRGANDSKASGERLHKFLVGASGGIGGAFGLVSLPVELPVSTTLMLRSIADIARSEGHDLRQPATQMACLEVFALGGRTSADNATDSAYWAVRTALARAVSEAATYLAERGVMEKGAPAVLRLVTAIAARFGVVVSEQAAAKAVPVVGAAGGAVINVLFMNHFQDMARGHFIVKRLEAKYGTAEVESAYLRLESDFSPRPEENPRRA